jgi:hypothetical protein
MDRTAKLIEFTRVIGHRRRRKYSETIR